MISVIVPVYNVLLYLADCIESIRRQTYEDIEILLVDDGSTDGSGRLCDDLATQDSRITVIHQSNAGLSAARNAGIEAATGELICFVDSDDLIAPDYCEILLELLQSSMADLSVCAVKRFRNENELPRVINNPEIIQNNKDSNLDSRQQYNVNIDQKEYRGDSGSDGRHNVIAENISSIAYLQRQLDRKTEFGVWNKLYRKDLLEEMRFVPGRIHEDVIWSGDLVKNCKNGVILTSQELYYYRQRSSGIVAASVKRCSADRVFAGEYLVKAAEEVTPELKARCIQYAIEYPMSFVDGIYVHRQFRENRQFLRALQEEVRRHYNSIMEMNCFDDIMKQKLKVFSKSRFVYGVNAYLRLFRVYLFRVFRRDAYQDGHGI